MKNTEQQIVKFIRRKIRESKAKGIVVGLSGGIDSSMVAVLVRKALGKNKVLGLIMPCESNPQDEIDAKLLCKEFDIPYEIINLEQGYFNLINTIPLQYHSKMANANIKARLRMCTLYYVANTKNYLVSGTGNKSEISIGYFTKWGDSASDILPIGDLYKFQVKNLAQHLNIPQQIIDKIPTAGLWQGQTDEGEMGISYKELDTILNDFELYNIIDIANYEIARAYGLLTNPKVQKVVKMIKNSNHKRQLPETCKLK